MRLISLFSGLGGFDLAARWAGWTTTHYSEIEPWACKVMAHHFPEARNLGDITTVDWRTVERPDCLAGGFPCQPNSTAGRRLGIEDERWLWPEFARAIGILRPRYVIAENVPGLATVNGGAGFAEVVRDLRRLGYVGYATPVSAADMGAPHLRERLWIVGKLADAENANRRPGERGTEAGIGPHGERGRGHPGGGARLGHAKGTGLEERDDTSRSEEGRETQGRHGFPSHDFCPWADAVAVRGADGIVRLVPRDAVGGRGDGEHDRPSGGLQPAFWPLADEPARGLAGRPGVRGDEAQAWATPQAHDTRARGRGQRAKRAAGTSTSGNACLASDAYEFASEAHATWRTTWPVVSGMPNRAAGCRLVGNSIVPGIPYAIFAAINRIEGAA